MNIEGLSTNGLLLLHDAITRALTEDDAIPTGMPKKFGVREYPDWKKQADQIEALLWKKGAPFSPIAW